MCFLSLVILLFVSPTALLPQETFVPEDSTRLGKQARGSRKLPVPVGFHWRDVSAHGASPDGTLVVLVTPRRLYLLTRSRSGIDVDLLQLTGLLYPVRDGEWLPETPIVWSHDGKRFAFVSRVTIADPADPQNLRIPIFRRYVYRVAVGTISNVPMALFSETNMGFDTEKYGKPEEPGWDLLGWTRDDSGVLIRLHRDGMGAANPSVWCYGFDGTAKPVKDDTP
ncbi:MAG: PD40 domain-containing protein [Armatimonadetes bacterium]|nr:PD40 domain-containing protein [Armatimonadota bacterium]